jgi:hypothetical protein
LPKTRGGSRRSSMARTCTTPAGLVHWSGRPSTANTTTTTLYAVQAGSSVAVRPLCSLLLYCLPSCRRSRGTTGCSFGTDEAARGGEH